MLVPQLTEEPHGSPRAAARAPADVTLFGMQDFQGARRQYAAPGPSPSARCSSCASSANCSRTYGVPRVHRHDGCSMQRLAAKRLGTAIGCERPVEPRGALPRSERGGTKIAKGFPPALAVGSVSAAPVAVGRAQRAGCHARAPAAPPSLGRCSRQVLLRFLGQAPGSTPRVRRRAPSAFASIPSSRSVAYSRIVSSIQ